MNRFQNKSRPFAVAMVIAALGVASLPGFVVAGSDPLSFDVTIGWYCVQGAAPAGSSVQLTWKDKEGNRKARVSLVTDSSGYWIHCNAHGKVVEIGDQIRASEGGSSRLFVVPELSLVINRVDDFFKGRGPANQYVRLFCWYTNGFEPCQLSWKLRVNWEGKWSYRPNDAFDVVGWQSMGLSWRSAQNDLVSIGAHGPYVDATIGSAIVRGAARANSIATVVLRRAGSNDVVGTAVTTADPDGDFTGKFRNAAGNLVKVRPGDRITSDVAADEDWIVPKVTGSADADTDIVTGTCPSDSFFVRAIVMRNGYPDGDHDWPEEDGSFELNLSDVDVQPGETVRVSCYLLGLGDWAGRAIVAN